MAALRDRIRSTLDSNTSTRQQAELDLKYVCATGFAFAWATVVADEDGLQAETQPGFPNALLDILQTEQDNAVQLSGMELSTGFSVSALNRYYVIRDAKILPAMVVQDSGG